MYQKIFNKLLIIDGSYLLHRSLHIKNLFDLRGPNGKRSGGIYQVLKSINFELRGNDYFPVVCWDAGLSDRRVKADNNYKHALERNNESVVLTEEELDNDYLTQYRTQRSALIDILSSVGIPSLRFNKWEGDDLMYILSKMSKESLVLTDDKDLLQLVSDTCNVRRPMADQLYTKNKLLEEYDINTVNEFVFNKSIIGDGSDNIPGCCKGVSGGTSGNIIKIMNLCKDLNIDFKEIIHKEDELRNLCKDNGIKFFKSYTNFDINRFVINVELIDLKKVDKDITDELMESIISTVSNCRNNVDYFSFIKKLNNYAIRDINSDELIGSIKTRFDSLGV